MRKGHHQYVTVISDLENHCLLEVIDSHKIEEIIEAVKSLWTEEERLSVEEVSIDMWAGFAKVIKPVFPRAHIVYDLCMIDFIWCRKLSRNWTKSDDSLG